DPAPRAEEGEPRDRRGHGRRQVQLRREDHPAGAAPARVARDLGRPQRQGVDPGRDDAARARRLRARDPRARQGGRAAPGPRQGVGLRLTPKLLAIATALAGLVAVVSAATPETAGRSEIVESLLSQGIPDLARTLTLAFGIGLLWLARGLARRKRRAWQ